MNRIELSGKSQGKGRNGYFQLHSVELMNIPTDPDGQVLNIDFYPRRRVNCVGPARLLLCAEDATKLAQFLGEAVESRPPVANIEHGVLVCKCGHRGTPRLEESGYQVSHALVEIVGDTIAQLETSDIELRRLREETIRRLSWAAEFRNQETGEHIVRMSLYCALLARLAGLDAERAEDIRIASPMHDVGKIGIPDRIMLKPGRLTDDERKVMEAHTEMGHRILAGSDVDLLDLAALMALTHHERIDGTGYPAGLAGDDIPIEGRITAVADVFDALTSDRVYRPAFQPDEAREMMEKERATQFDAGLLDLFFGAFDDVLAIRRSADTGNAEQTLARALAAVTTRPKFA
jgi:HD-GYP domain-containing protein (c-di-GMP phosphodiesterase class II)